MPDELPPAPHAPTDTEVLGLLQAFADVGFWEYDLRTDELYLSTQGFELIGLDEPSVPAYLERVHPDDVELLGQVHQRARVQPGPYRVRHRTRDGERLLQLRVQSVADDTGRPVRYLGVISDVTTEWQLEQALEASSSARLAGILASGAVHDLKNIFAVLLGHAQLAVAAVERGEVPAAESFGALERAATRGLDLTTQLLQVGREAPIAARRVVVADLFRRLEVTASTVLGRHRRLEVDPGPGSHDLLADASRLERVVVDLVLNARDALPEGGSVHLSFRPLDDEEVRRLVDERGLPTGSFGVLEVRDTGTGIEPDLLARVTDPFFTTKGATGGTGIGLHTVARFAAAAGGLLDIASEVGVGTAVRLVLPTRPSAAQPVRRHRRPLRALVHGHDRARLDALAEALAAARVQVVPSTSTMTSAAVLRTEPIDVVVSDASPGGDATLLRVASATATPVIGVAAAAGPAAGPDLDDGALRAVVDAVERLFDRDGQRLGA
ncbi:MAG: ATP-binding protein [Acidimicrobiia bacterium]